MPIDVISNLDILNISSNGEMEVVTPEGVARLWGEVIGGDKKKVLAEKFVDGNLKEKSFLEEAYVSFPVELADQGVGGVFGKPIDAGDDKIYFYNTLRDHLVGVQTQEDERKSLVLVRNGTHRDGRSKTTVTRFTPTKE